MSTPNGLKGNQADQYAPYQTDPVPAPGTVQTALLDPSNFQSIRGPVLTDEGGFREMFAIDPFTAPSTEWITNNTGGAGLVVAGGVFTFTAGAVPNGISYVIIPVDYLPLQFSFELDEVAGRTIAATSPDFFFGMYSDVDVNAAISAGEFLEQLWLGNGTNTSGTFRSGAGGNFQTTTHTITGRTTEGFRSLLLDAESAQVRDGTTVLPTTTVRATHSVKIPGLTTELYLAIGFRNPAGVVTPWAVQVRAILNNNTNRLRVNTGW